MDSWLLMITLSLSVKSAFIYNAPTELYNRFTLILRLTHVREQNVLLLPITVVPICGLQVADIQSRCNTQIFHHSLIRPLHSGLLRGQLFQVYVHITLYTEVHRYGTSDYSGLVLTDKIEPFRQ